MLPFFFRHYDGWVDRYVIFDDGSTDRTQEMLARHPKVERRPLLRSHPDSYALSQQTLADHCWKESRGAADWVILADLDEHLFHPAMGDYLAAAAAAGVTLLPALGFQMVSDRPPRAGELLCEALPFGAPWSQMMKPSIFDPDAIAEINFATGRHTAAPTGRVRLPERDEVLLLHYKYLGPAATLVRYRELQSRLGQPERDNNWCHKWSWSADDLAADWRCVAEQAVDVRRVDAAAYPITPWWRPKMPMAPAGPPAVADPLMPAPPRPVRRSPDRQP